MRKLISHAVREILRGRYFYCEPLTCDTFAKLILLHSGNLDPVRIYYNGARLAAARLDCIRSLFGECVLSGKW